MFQPSTLSVSARRSLGSSRSQLTSTHQDSGRFIRVKFTLTCEAYVPTSPRFGGSSSNILLSQDLIPLNARGFYTQNLNLLNQETGSKQALTTKVRGGSTAQWTKNRLRNSCCLTNDTDSCDNDSPQSIANKKMQRDSSKCSKPQQQNQFSPDKIAENLGFVHRKKSKQQKTQTKFLAKQNSAQRLICKSNTDLGAETMDKKEERMPSSRALYYGENIRCSQEKQSSIKSRQKNLCEPKRKFS